MPSLEILCVDAAGAVSVDDLPFAVQTSENRRSHRPAPSRFQADFDAYLGVLFHLGNPGSRDGYAFFAYELFDHASDGSEVEPLVLRSDIASSVRTLLERMMTASSAKQLIVTTDWQFGPAESIHRGPFTLADFWAAHDARELRYNGAYTLVG